MEQSSFTITCTTCQVQLTVRDMSLIGQIVPCPKCQSMVLIAPPEGWTGSSQPAASKPSPAEPTSVEPKIESPAIPPPPPIAKVESDQPSLAEQPASRESTPETVRASNEPRWTRAAGVVPPPLPVQRSLDQAAPAGESQIKPINLNSGLSPTEQLWRKGLLWIGVPTVSVILIAAIVFLAGSRDRTAPENQTPTPPVTDQSTEKPTNQPSPTNSVPAADLPSAGMFSADWVPDQACLVVSVAPSRLVNRSGADRLLDVASPLWKPVLGRVINAFGLRLDQLRRATWSTGELSDPSDPGLLVIEVDENCDLRRLVDASVPMGVRFRGVSCRRLTETAWEEPFALIGKHTIVTGKADVLTPLGIRAVPHLTSRALAAMLDAVPRDSELTVMVDLQSARQAGWQPPEKLMNVWPAGIQSWQTLCRVPTGLGVDLRIDDHAMHGTIDLVMADQTDANAVLGAVERLTPLAKAALDTKVKSLETDADQGGSDEAYRLLLHETAGALDMTRWELLDTTVRITTNWGQDLSGAGLLVVDAFEAIETDWTAAIEQSIKSQQLRLVDGLDDYSRDKGSFPAAAVGGALLPPETRLSWIATMLPYYGHENWYKQLKFGYRWDDEQNVSVTRRVLPEVVNPAFGPATAGGDFPVTYYVGSTGLGEGAGRLDVKDPRAGVFGFGRTVQPNQIADGASNTIAVLGVCDDLGPWASGGRTTARSLARQPYVNGPDGFGTGQPNGMYVGMADGSVRFITKDVDPRVMEAMVTINGGEPPVAVDDVEQETTTQPAVAADEKTASKPETVAVEPGTKPDEAQPQAIPPEIAAPLARPLETVKYSDVELGDLVREMRELTGLDIRFDIKSLAKAEITLDSPISVEQEKTTVGELLKEALSQCGLVYEVRDGVLIVTAAEEKD